MASPQGEAYTGSFTVKNEGPEAKDVLINVSDWTLSERGKITFKEPGSLSRSINRYLEFSPKQVIIPPNSSREISFKVMPNDHGEKSRWGVFLVRSLDGNRGGGEGVNIGVTVQHAVTIYQEAMEEDMQGTITGVEVEKKDGMITFAVAFRNDCEAFLHPEGRIEITMASGDLQKEVPIESNLVLPDTTRLFTFEIGRGSLPPGEYNALVVIDFGGDHLVGARLGFEVEQ